MKYFKPFRLFESSLVINVNKGLKNLLGSYDGKVVAGGVIIPLNAYNDLSDDDKNTLNNSIGIAITFAEDLIEELSTKPNIEEPIIEEPILSKPGNFYFLRWTSSPEDDIQRNFSGHMQTWVDTEEEAWKKRKEENVEYLYEPKYDTVSGMWNYDPEWGISGYGFKDEESFNKAMQNIKEIGWHHKDNKKQDLALFSAVEIGPEEGYDGEDLYRDITFISYVDEDTTFSDIDNLLRK